MTREEMAAKLERQIASCERARDLAKERGRSEYAKKMAAVNDQRAKYYGGLLGDLEAGRSVETIAYLADAKAQFETERRARTAQVAQMADSYIRENGLESGRYELRVLYVVKCEANYEKYERVEELKRGFSQLKDAIKSARHLAAELGGDAYIDAAHFPYDAGRHDRCGYEKRGGVETVYNEEVNGAVLEIADGDDSKAEHSPLEELRERAAGVRRLFGAAAADMWLFAEMLALLPDMYHEGTRL